MTWNKKLKQLRQSRGLNQKELAEKANLTQGLISGLENNKKKFTQDNLDAILGVLNYSYKDLFGDEETNTCTLPPGYGEFYSMLTEILSQSSDEQIKNALRTDLVAFKNSIIKDINALEKDNRIDNLEKRVDYLTELYDRKIKSDT